MSEQNSRFRDSDPLETQEWLDALAAVIEKNDLSRAENIIESLLTDMRMRDVSESVFCNTPYVNSIPKAEEAQHPGDLELEKRIDAFIRWNAMVMVLRAGKRADSVGGHIATYASAATLYEMGFNHFFNAPTADHGGDLIYMQGHSAPGVYARAYLEGRITEEQLINFRQEVSGHGLASYPHPHLMPDFWQFATVSMGLGPIMGIYQARFLKYLQNRELNNTEDRKVWVFCGDGEMDEPESLGAISLASRAKLDNLVFVVNCNLQRLDGPVRGNGKIIQELERVFRGGGWNVLKVLWGESWEPLFALDSEGYLRQSLEETVDGDYQNFVTRDIDFVREHFFAKYPQVKAIADQFSDKDLWMLRRGGHCPQKVYAAYAKAVATTGRPTVILAHTVKGYGMGAAGEAQNIAHNKKKMGVDEVKKFRDRFKIPVSDDKIEELPFIKFDDDSEEAKYLHAQRQALGGYLPQRRQQSSAFTTPDLDKFASLLKDTGDREISTTMAFVRWLNIVMKDKKIGQNVVPIVPDECRTFGMEGMFRQFGIYAPKGQLYQPVDSEQLMYYREDKKGQILEEGLNEAGAASSWIAAGTSYSNSDVPMIPFYVFYSMFGFQRTGDLFWAAADMQAQGFLMGATAGRTTLAGEGLQHCDGHTHLMAATIPTCHAYDPAFSYELAVILQDGLRRMYQEHERIFYYVTITNENYHHPEMPKNVEDGIIKGMYLFKAAKGKTKKRVQLLGSGTILREVIAAADILAKDFGVLADIWSVTSFTQLRRDGMDVERYNRLNPGKKAKQSYVEKCLIETEGPVIAASDYMRSFADQIREFIPEDYITLGTDGFGRSDTRAALREFFEVDSKSIAFAALSALYDQDNYKLEDLKKAMKKLKIDAKKVNPWSE